MKVKTYESDGDTEYLSNLLETNDLIPLLKCISPCKFCHDGKVDTRSLSLKIDKRFCTECWQDFPQKYRQVTTPWDEEKGTGQATCQTNCNKGFTSNGSNPKKCENCEV
jgi:hypothetical protein